VYLHLHRAEVVYFSLLGDFLHILDLEVFGVVVCVFEIQLLAVHVDFGSVFQLSLVIDEGIVGIDHDLEWLGV
jgi:hypothetical protein